MERDQAFSNMRREKVFFQTSEDLKNSFPIDGLSNGMFLDWSRVSEGELSLYSKFK